MYKHTCTGVAWQTPVRSGKLMSGFTSISDSLPLVLQYKGIGIVIDSIMSATCDLPQDASRDQASLRMIASLLLEDLGQVKGHRKDKRREDAPPTDEEVAIDLFAAELRSTLEIQDDQRVAQSLAAAVDTPVEGLEQMDNLPSSATARRIPVAGGSGEPQSVKSSNGPAPCNDTPDNDNHPPSISCPASPSEQ